MADEQGSNNGEQSLLPVNDSIFIQVAHGDDYIVYQERDERALGDIVVDVFLERVPDKGWWGGVRLNGRFRLQLSLDRQTLFPTPEVALLATEEFLADEARVRTALEDMRRDERTLQTFHNAPRRPPDVDPEKYFSPVLLEVNGTSFTLYHLTNTEAAYRSWPQKRVAGIAIDLRLAHVYGKGWQAGLRFPGSGAVEFEPAINQLFLTPEKALETLLTFCSEEENVRQAAQRVKELGPQERMALRPENTPIVPAKPSLRVNNKDFIWKQRVSQEELYQAKQIKFVRFTRVHIQLVETWRNEWLGRVQFAGIAGVHFEKDIDIGFSIPEDAFAAVNTFLSFKASIHLLRDADAKRVVLECQTGKYDRLMSISSSVEGEERQV